MLLNLGPKKRLSTPFDGSSPSLALNFRCYSSNSNSPLISPLFSFSPSKFNTTTYKLQKNGGGGGGDGVDCFEENKRVSGYN